jgi:hypothetical protein
LASLLSLSRTTHYSGSLLSGTSLREAKVKVLEIGPLHNNLGKSPLFKLVMDGAFRTPYPHLQRQIRVLFYTRFSVRLTELLFLSYTARGFIEYTSPPLDFTSIMALHEKHFTGPE